MYNPDDNQPQKKPVDPSGGAGAGEGSTAKIAWLTPVLTRPQRLTALALTAIAYWLVCFTPYDWVAPASYTLNDARVVPSDDTGSSRLIVRGMGIANLVGDLESAWQVAPASVHLQLRVRCELAEQFGPARILTLSADTSTRNFMLGQDGEALVVRLLRPDSNPNGVPEYRVDEFFTGCAAREIDLRMAGGALQLHADGQLVLNVATPAASLERWLTVLPLHVGNEGTWDRGWSGDVSELRLTVDDEVIVDGIDDLQLPHGAWLLSQRAQRTHRFTLVPFSKGGVGSLVDIFANVIGFLPFGLLLALGWGSRLNALYAGLLAGLLSSSIELGQIGFAGRFPSTTDISTNTFGGILGFVIGMFWLRRKRNQEQRTTGRL